MPPRRLDKNRFRDDLFKIVDNADRTKGVQFQISGVTSGNTRVLTVPDFDFNFNSPIFPSLHVYKSTGDVYAHIEALENRKIAGIKLTTDYQGDKADSYIGHDYFGEEYGVSSHGLNYISGRAGFAHHWFRDDENNVLLAIKDGGDVEVTGNLSAGAITGTSFVIGGNTLASFLVLEDLAALGAVADNEFIVGTGAGVYAHESGATARTSLGLGVGDNVEFNDIIGTDITVNDDLFVSDQASIGTTSQSIPYNFGVRTHTLRIDSDGVNEYSIGLLQRANDTSVPIITIGKSVGASSVADNQGLGTINFIGFVTDVGGDKYYRAASILVRVDGNPTTTSMPGEMILQTTPVGGVGPLARMTIAPDGSISIGGAVTWSGGGSANANDAYAKRVDTWTAPLAFSSNTASIAQANTSTDGYLSQTDWDTFNDKADYSFGANNFSGTGTIGCGTITLTANSDVLLSGTGKIGVGDTPVAPIDIFQPTDNAGIRVRGFDDRVGNIGDFRINESGNFSVDATNTMVFTAQDSLYFRAGIGESINFADNTNANIFLGKGGGETRIGTAANYSSFVAGTLKLVGSGNSILTFDKSSGRGIKVDTATPTFGWRDLLGPIIPKIKGGTAPAFTAFRGANVKEYAFQASDIIEDITFHIPHDYVEGTDLHLHLHWGHNGTAISGSLVVDYYLTYAKGHGQAIFNSEMNITQTISTPNVATQPQWSHEIDEIQITNDGGDATHFDRALIEPDGVIKMALITTTIPTITGSATSDLPYLFTVDVHYQSTNIATKNKVADFYA